MSKSEVKIQVVKIESKTVEESTVRMLTTPVGDGIRLSNQEIVKQLLETHGRGSINCVRWYSSKIKKDSRYCEKYGIKPSLAFLTPRVAPKD